MIIPTLSPGLLQESEVHGGQGAKESGAAGGQGEGGDGEAQWPVGEGGEGGGQGACRPFLMQVHQLIGQDRRNLETNDAIFKPFMVLNVKSYLAVILFL